MDDLCRNWDAKTAKERLLGCIGRSIAPWKSAIPVALFGTLYAGAAALTATLLNSSDNSFDPVIASNATYLAYMGREGIEHLNGHLFRKQARSMIPRPSQITIDVMP